MKRKIQAGTTSFIDRVFVRDTSQTSKVAGLTGLTSGTSGLTLYYCRAGDSASTSVTLAAETLGTWSSGGIVATDGTHMPGEYEIGVPNAAIASGAPYVTFRLRGATNMEEVSWGYDLDAINYQDSVRAGLTALPNAAAGASSGLPLSVDSSGRVDVLKINGTSQTAGDLYGYLTTNIGALGANATGLASAVWSVATRVLTAGTNIVLAKGTGLTGLNDIAATAVVSGGAITTSSGKVSEVTLVDTLTTYTGNTPQTGDAYGYLVSNLGALGAAATGIASAVWSYATRVLTAGTNIVLAKGTGVTGFNDPATATLAASQPNYAPATSAQAIAIKAQTDLIGTNAADSSNVASAAARINAFPITDNKPWVLSDNGNPVAEASAVAAIPTSPPATVTLDASQPNYAPAQASDVTASQTAIISHGDAHWEGSGGGGSATLENQLAILGKLSGATVRILSPLALDQHLSLVAGDDYYSADGRAPAWSIQNYTGPDLTDATVTFVAISKADFDAGNPVAPLISLSGTASVVSSTALFTVEIPGSDTSGLSLDERFDCVYQLTAVVAGHTITEAIGPLTIKRSVG